MNIWMLLIILWSDIPSGPSVALYGYATEDECNKAAELAQAEFADKPVSTACALVTKPE